jgi:hypothetical protein
MIKKGIIFLFAVLLFSLPSFARTLVSSEPVCGHREPQKGADIFCSPCDSCTCYIQIIYDDGTTEQDPKPKLKHVVYDPGYDEAFGDIGSITIWQAEGGIHYEIDLLPESVTFDAYCLQDVYDWIFNH